jgi:hypothetical protein
VPLERHVDRDGREITSNGTPIVGGLQMSQEAQYVLAIGVAAALVIVALAFAAPAIFTAFGLAVAAARTGVAASLPSWLVTSTTIVVNVALFTSAGAVAAKTIDAMRRHLFTSVAVAMGGLQGAILDSLKELWPTGSWLKIAFSAGAALLFTIGALFWHREGIKSKLFAIILFLLAPVAALARAVAAQTTLPSTFGEALGGISGTTWLVLAAIAGMVVATMLAHLVVASDPV